MGKTMETIKPYSGIPVHRDPTAELAIRRLERQEKREPNNFGMEPNPIKTRERKIVCELTELNRQKFHNIIGRVEYLNRRRELRQKLKSLTSSDH